MSLKRIGPAFASARVGPRWGWCRDNAESVPREHHNATELVIFHQLAIASLLKVYPGGSLTSSCRIASPRTGMRNSVPSAYASKMVKLRGSFEASESDFSRLPPTVTKISGRSSQ